MLATFHGQQLIIEAFVYLQLCLPTDLPLLEGAAYKISARYLQLHLVQITHRVISSQEGGGGGGQTLIFDTSRRV